MTTTKKGTPKLSPFAQMLRDKREKLAPNITLREFCAARGFDAPLIDGMERDRRTASRPGRSAPYQQHLAPATPNQTSSSPATAVIIMTIE